MESRCENLRGQQCRFGFAFAHVGFDDHQTWFAHRLGYADGFALHRTQFGSGDVELLCEQCVRITRYLHGIPRSRQSQHAPCQHRATLRVETVLVSVVRRWFIQRAQSAIAGNPIGDDDQCGQQNLGPPAQRALMQLPQDRFDPSGFGDPVKHLEPHVLPCFVTGEPFAIPSMQQLLFAVGQRCAVMPGDNAGDTVRQRSASRAQTLAGHPRFDGPATDEFMTVLRPVRAVADTGMDTKPGLAHLIGKTGHLYHEGGRRLADVMDRRDEPIQQSGCML
nr:hypothetical protein [Bifidobacterium aerophilum]